MFDDKSQCTICLLVEVFCTVAVLKRHAVRYFILSQTELKDQTICSTTTAPTDERLELGEQTVYSTSRAPNETQMSLLLRQDLAESIHP